MCALPWLNLNTTPQGQCKLCCHISDFKVISAAKNIPVGWGRNTIDQIWNGMHMREVRRRMLTGEEVPDCGECYAMERAGMISPRESANERELSRLDLDALTEVAVAVPVSLELRLSTRCNLKCTTCWSGSSDRIAEERHQALSDGTDLPEWMRVDWQNDIALNEGIRSDPRYIDSHISLDNFKAVAPRLERLYITGGEPTMESRIYAYLDVMAAAGNNQCHVSFTTNCTLWNDKLMERMARFPNNEIQLSIDGHESVAELVRYPTHWDDVHANIEKYMSDTRIQTLRIFTVYSALNAAELPALLRYLVDTSNRFRRDCVWWPIMLSYPAHLRTNVLKDSTRERIATQLEDIDRDIDNLIEAHCNFRDGLRQVIKKLREPETDDGEHARSKLHTYLDVMDNLRGTQWQTSLPNMQLES
jgi:MoaA/NifB/PqqE/SkfB family radical SAM enzyme